MEHRYHGTKTVIKKLKVNLIKVDLLVHIMRGIKMVKKIEAQFSEGKLIGSYTSWDNQGKVIDKLFFKNGICVDC